MHRRTVLAGALASAGLAGWPASALAAPALVVRNVTGLYDVAVARIAEPRSTGDVVAAVRAWPGRIGIGGGRYSMGGQVAVADGLHLDLRAMNRIVWLRPADLRVRVQAGATWRDLQGALDPLGLAVKTMQSYANFTVGGSVSVNAHGRYVRHGPVGETVRALQLVLADGQVVEASRDTNADLFAATIGGYGAIGVVTEVELDVARNLRIERAVTAVPLADYVRHVRDHVLADPAAILHNADLLPPGFDAPVAVTWRRAVDTTGLTDTARLVPRGAGYPLERSVLWAVSELPGGDALRRGVVHPLLTSGRAARWLNREASLDVASLEPRSRERVTYALQEYFVPAGGFMGFARRMQAILREHRARVLNVSLRHATADGVSLLPWASGDVHAFVLYHRQGTDAASRAAVGAWTRALVDACLAEGGRHYLPYQPHATRAQVERGYPGLAKLREVKRRVDPDARYTSEFWRRYL